MHVTQVVTLVFAGIIAGLLNSVAGGGGFIAFPALLYMGLPPITANATMTVSLWPGAVASVGAYRREYTAENGKLMWPLFVTSLIGALAGAMLLLKTPQKTFLDLVPWLMLAATLLFAFSGQVTQWVRTRAQREAELHQVTGEAHRTSRLTLISGMLMQLVFAVYIGYFGAGAGILILALLALMGMENIHTMNAFKIAFAACSNGVAIVTFILARKVAWPHAMVMIGGSIIGGYLGAWYAQKLPPQRVRYIVICVGAVITSYFFWRR